MTVFGVIKTIAIRLVICPSTHASGASASPAGGERVRGGKRAGALHADAERAHVSRDAGEICLIEGPVC